jgi:hypothetical protein
MLLNAPHTYLTSGLNSFTFTPGPATSGPVYVDITDATSPAYPIYSYFSGTAQFTIDTITLDSIVLTPMNVVSQIASDDQYHYGFNGQMKVNEWAGVGNRNTAMFWEYDTRTGMRLNQDPRGSVWESPYSTFGRNPIWKLDPLGDSAWYKDKDGKLIFDANLKTAEDMEKLQLVGSFMGSTIHGQTPGPNSVSYAGDKNGQWSFYSNNEVEIRPDAWHVAKEDGYSPMVMPDLFQGFGGHGNLGAGGIIGSGGGSLGGYFDENGNVGIMGSGAAGYGLSAPGISASLGIDFYRYGNKLKTAPKEFINGTSVSTSLQLGVFSFTKTSSSDYNSPLKPNGGLSVYSFDVGLKGFGYSTKIGLTKYIGY